MDTFMLIFQIVFAFALGIMLIISGMVLSPTDRFNIRKLLLRK